MKSLQRLCAAVALTFALTLPALAGGMHTGPGVASPPPPDPASATAQGDMHTGMGIAETADDSFTGTVSSLLAAVLSLF